ncbi:hypothetical protein [Streptomyces poonensis]|uniref:Uncharacterized protein n=1 Tax=Streptomyces poonensis TaxID=68255 RepID=A0A918PJA6_9ACTN|nr:hypothetical protein [Streptomyces poonensis]GGZ12970.1 hypothetical protein GCM10010365_35920 [Streptomyces poonensis]GLJ91953.1 hypothetical protein GCM10017589_45610 [Streptomyces poonensis]
MPEPKSSLARRGRGLARTTCVAVLLLVVTIAGPTIAQATDTHSAHRAEHGTAMVQQAISNAQIDEIKEFIAQLVRDFAEIIKPSISVQFGVTMAVTLVGGYTLCKIVISLRRGGRRSRRDHDDHYICHEHQLCHACHGTRRAHR